jgi:hypothetical protein
MEPRMLDKINDLKRLNDEVRLASIKHKEIKDSILSVCKEILERSALTVNDLSDYMTPF